jgi:hypothetical protein
MIIDDLYMWSENGARYMDIHSTLIGESLEESLLPTDTTCGFLGIIATRIANAFCVIVSIAISVVF